MDGLRAKNHEISQPSWPSVVGSIRLRCRPADLVLRSNDYCIEAVSDGRKGGSPAGF